MKDYFNKKSTYNEVNFQLANTSSVDEREMHSYHEILFCTDLNAVFLTETQQKKIRGDVLFLIPKETYHYFHIQECDKFSRLKIYFPSHILESIHCSNIMKEIHIFEKIDENVLFVLKRLRNILEEDTSEKQGIYSYSAFLMLLTELDRLDGGMESPQEIITEGDLPRIIRYITEHLSTDLSIETLSKKLNVSCSVITHTFQKRLGISVHRYITQKRLIDAQRRILSGEKPSKLYHEYHYRDYSSFYKAYILFFGHSPSNEKLSK